VTTTRQLPGRFWGCEYNRDFLPVVVARLQSEAYDFERLLGEGGLEEGSMEQIISGLLQDFEAGKLTRRQLIQALALGVTAGPAALAAQKPAEQSSIPPPRSPAPWKTVWLDHISYAVSDYRRSTAFYRDLMGWEIIHDDGQKQCSMKVGKVGGIIIRNRAGYAGAAGGTNQPTITGLIDHISWGVEP